MISTSHQHSFLGIRGVVVAWICLLGVLCEACQVPVFRYALERWEPASYLLTVTPGHDGLTAEEKGIVDLLQHPETPANLVVEIKPPAEKSSMTLHDPRTRAGVEDKPIWRAELSKKNALALLSSPAREELRRRLLGGQTATWLLLESGDAAKDNAAFATLEASMKTVTEHVKLPDGVITQDEASQPSDGRRHENADVLQSDLPLKIEFSVLRLSRADRQEAALVSMLMHLEPDLGDYIGEPMVFPVFGRGRALEPLIGKGIHSDNILETAAYLCGACSCEIKDQNPGMDLLLAANGEPVDNTPKIETVRFQPSALAAETSSAPAVGGRIRWSALAAALVLIGGLLWRKTAST